MRAVVWRAALIGLALGACLLPARAFGQQSAPEPLTNESVVKLVRAGFSEKTLVAIIRTRPARFDLAPERLIELKKSGVSEKIILAMLARQQSDAVAGGEVDDDAFFGAGGPDMGDAHATPAKPGEVNIFGSAGGSRGRVRSRGGSGDADGDTQTTGSATVRILRPPAEAGGSSSAPKLEKTPTLTNDAVVELVEAGFSEGTIIRRIEQSPVEFDLSTQKLAELRKRRVTEPIINAMRAAMSDDGEQAPKP